MLDFLVEFSGELGDNMGIESVLVDFSKNHLKVSILFFNTYLCVKPSYEPFFWLFMKAD